MANPYIIDTTRTMLDAFPGNHVLVETGSERIVAICPIWPGGTDSAAEHIQTVVNCHDDLLAALKECALEIAQIRNRRLTANEQDALDNARAVLAKAEGRS